MFLTYLVFELIAILTFFIINYKQPFDSPEVKIWLQNYKKGCGKEMDLNNALQNDQLS